MKLNKMFWFSGFVIDFGLVIWILSLFPSSLDLMLLLSSNVGSTITDTSLAQFSFGVMGSVTVGWGIVLLYFSQIEVDKFDTRRMKKYLLSSLFIWYVLDTIISIISTFYINAISNTVLTVIGWYIIANHLSESN